MKTNPLEPLFSLMKDKEVYGPIMTIILAFIVYYIIKSIVTKIINHEENRSDGSYNAKKRRTIIDLISNIIKYVILIVTILVILEIYNINTTSIIASLGVASAIVGLAFQDALKDFIGGITIVLENYYMVGDYIKYGDFVGKVSELGLKSTKVTNFDNEVLIIANRNVTQVINYSQCKANIHISIPVAYEVEPSIVEEAIFTVLNELTKINNIIPKTMEYYGIEKLDSSSVNYLIGFMCDSDSKWQAKREALKIIKDIFDKQNIKIPYNQIEVHNGKNI